MNTKITPEEAAKIISDYLICGMHHSTKETQLFISDVIKQTKNYDH